MKSKRKAEFEAGFGRQGREMIHQNSKQISSRVRSDMEIIAEVETADGSSGSYRVQQPSLWAWVAGLYAAGAYCSNGFVLFI